jgi:hypothetical protein
MLPRQSFVLFHVNPGVVSLLPLLQAKSDVDTHDEETDVEERELVLKLDGKQIDNESLQSIFERRCDVAQVRPPTLVVANQASSTESSSAGSKSDPACSADASWFVRCFQSL